MAKCKGWDLQAVGAGAHIHHDKHVFGLLGQKVEADERALLVALITPARENKTEEKRQREVENGGGGGGERRRKRRKEEKKGVRGRGKQTQQKIIFLTSILLIFFFSFLLFFLPSFLGSFGAPTSCSPSRPCGQWRHS